MFQHCSFTTLNYVFIMFLLKDTNLAFKKLNYISLQYAIYAIYAI